MPKIIKPLAAAQCKQLRYSETDRTANRIRDGRGLILEARSNGRKVWLLEYKLGRKRSYATMPHDYGTESGTLSAARQWREVQHALIAEGIDPNEHAKQQRVTHLSESDSLFKTVSEEWIAFKVNSGDWGQKQQKKANNIVCNHLHPAIGRRHIAAITTQELLVVVEGINSKGNAKLARQFVSAIFNRATIRGLRQDNPAVALKGQIATPDTRVHPHLVKPVEFGALLRAIDAYQANNFAVEFILKLSPLLFLRPTELREATWQEFDFQNHQWIIPKGRMKIRKPLVVPLSTQVLDLLKQLEAYSHHGDDSLLFPSPMDKGKAISDTPVRMALKSLGYKDEDGRLIVPHGFRHTASTLLNESGNFTKQVIEAQLSHAEKNQVAATYNKAEYINQRRRLMQYWSNYCDGLKSRDPLNVVAFKGSQQ